MQSFDFLPEDIKLIDRMSQEWGLNLYNKADQLKIADAILATSDFFIENPSAKTPWNLRATQIAYVYYFSPLNALRMHRLFAKDQGRLKKLVVNSVLDWGSGLASASRTFRTHFPQVKTHLVEMAIEPLKILTHLGTFSSSPEIPQNFDSDTLVCSYSLTEMSELPSWVFNFNNVFILEPATQSDGRRLQAWRQKLIDKNYSIWSPCTHHQSCPLLTQSKTDWCHDRFAVNAPDWFREVEQHLPMKNNTLTTSYLVASKQKAPALKSESVRLVGDLLREKGKDRQLMCRSSQREFLSWMHKHGVHPELYRGDLYDLPNEIQQVAKEVRILSR
ncbi:MAG: small ribosomal subunit Rsm22 family protein [Bdellovibrionia bacterium]